MGEKKKIYKKKNIKQKKIQIKCKSVETLYLYNFILIYLYLV